MMDNVLQLVLELELYDEIHRAVDGSRGDFVKVRREALTKLFVDHTRLLKRVPHQDPQKRRLTK